MVRKFSIAVLTILLASSPSRAEHGPPSVIVDSKVSQSCIQVEPSYMMSMQPGRVRLSKGPSISITNKCEKTANVVSFVEGSTPVTRRIVALVSMGAGYAQYSDFIFIRNAQSCTFPLQDKDSKNWTHCGNLPIEHGDTLMLPVTWGSAYHVTAIMGDDKVTIDGMLLNPRDPTQAVGLYEQAAKEGDAQAEYELAILYNRDGPAHDGALSATWLKRAASRGHTLAQIELAQRYETGTTVPKDEAKAYFWWILAAPHGWDGFYVNRQAAEKRLPEDKAAEVKKQAEEWTPESGPVKD
jgi:hypothetical protein